MAESGDRKYTSFRDVFFSNPECSVTGAAQRRDNPEMAVRREQITELVSILQDWKITLDDVVKTSPGDWKVRERAKEIACQVAGDQELMSFLLDHRTLPLQLLGERGNVDRKACQKHEKYIIAVALIVYHRLGDLVPYVLPRGRRGENAYC